MSAFIHDNETYDQILATLESNQYWREELTPEQFVRNLREWNYKSVDYRYRETNDRGNWEPNRRAEKLSPVELFKILQSVTYQSCEIPEYFQSTEYRIVLEIQVGAASKRLSNTAEYQAARW